jgi:hypothetical protein
MKVVFLDIDGVLNCSRTDNPRKFPYVVDRLLFNRFKTLLDRTLCTVVLSSTWRYDPVGLLAARHYGIPFEDVTPDLPHQPRNEEVLAWLENRKVDRFIVIDDEDDDLDDLPLFQPNAKIGLTQDIVDAAVAYLTGESDRDWRRNKIVDVVKNFVSAVKSHPG